MLDVEAGGPHSGPHAFAASTANREAIPLALFADFLKKLMKVYLPLHLLNVMLETIQKFSKMAKRNKSKPERLSMEITILKGILATKLIGEMKQSRTTFIRKANASLVLIIRRACQRVQRPPRLELHMTPSSCG